MAIDPVTPIPTQQQSPDSKQGRYSPEAIKMQREYAKMLMGQRQKPAFYTWANGLADASSQIMGGLADRQANEMEKSTADQADRARTATGYGNQAAGGAASNAPFSAANRAGGLRLSSLGQAQSPGQGSAPTIQDSTSSQESEEGGDVAKKAMTLSMMGETGKKSMAALFNISGDTDGSKSYGPFGLNSKTGSAAQYAKAYPEFGLTAKPGSPEFDAQWRRASASQGEGMRDAHTDWHGKNIMAGLSDSMTKAGIDPKIANDPRVKTYMADRKLQMGEVGLDTALQYAKRAGSPEEFIHTVSGVDKQRLGKNFPTYLKDHPDNVQGLHNRIDLRHNTSLAMANPEETGRFVDLYKGQNGGQQPTRVASLDPGVPSGGQAMAADPGGAVQQRAPQTPPQAPPQAGQPPARMAQNAQQQYRNPPIASSRLEEETSRFISGLVKSGYTLPEAMEIAGKEEERRKGSMPQLGVGEYGQITRTAPGEVPSITGMQPGAIGKVTKGIGGITVQEIWNPKTGRIEQIPVMPSFGDPKGQAPASATPPVRAPQSQQRPQPQPQLQPTQGTATVQAPTSQTAPVVAGAGATPSGPLGTPPPKLADVVSEAAAKPGQKFAALSVNDVFDVNPQEGSVKLNQNKLDRIASTQKIEMPSYDLDKPKTPIEAKAAEAVQQAVNNPAPLNELPGRIEQGISGARAARTPEAAIDAMGNIERLQKADETAEVDKLKDQHKLYAGLQKSRLDNMTQAEKLGPGIKASRRLLDSPDFEAGPLSGAVTQVRGLQEEAEKMFRRWAEDDKKNSNDPNAWNKSKDPSFWEKAADFVHNDHSASANQVYRKILSGSILQSLREMLGPNAGQFRVQELKMLEQAFGNPDITLNANKVVMDMIDRVNDRMMLTGEMTNKYLETHNTLDAGFERALGRFERENPVFNPNEYDELLRIGATGKSGKEAAPANQTPQNKVGPLGTPPPGSQGAPAPAPAQTAPKYKLPPGFRIE